MRAGVPLARLQLTHEKRRLLAAVAGVVFAVVLMLMQLGFEDALLSSAGLFFSRLKYELVLISPQYQFMLFPKSFTVRRVYQALGVPGVESVSYVYVTQASFKNPVTHRERNIFLVGFVPASAPLDLPGLEEKLEELRKPDVVLFDVGSRPEFGPIPELFRQHGRVFTEILGRRVEIAGLFALGNSFGADGNVLASDTTFLRLAPRSQPGVVDFGLIKLKPGADPERLRAQIAAMLPEDVLVLTRQGVMDREKNYWTASTPIGFIFKVGVLMGLIVGSIIVYQILYSDVTEHLPEYATLKAMGYPNRFLFSVVLQESMILSVLGFLPGLVISQGLYMVTKSATLLPIRLTIARAVAVYVLTAVMCAGSGALAMLKLQSADPADIF